MRDNVPVILQVLPKLESGGVERGTLEVAGALLEKGWIPVVVSGGGPMVRELERMGVKHITHPVETKNPFKIIKNAKVLEKIIREEGADVIHARSRAPAFSAKMAAKRTGAHFLTSFHGTYGLGPFGIKKPYNRIMTEGELVIAVSNFIQMHMMENYDVPFNKIRLIHRGVDIDRFNPSKITQERMINLVEKWRIPEDLSIIMLPARVSKWKGHDVLVEAVSRMKHKDVRCIFVGSDQGRKGFRSELDRLIDRKGVGSSIQFVDHCDEMPLAYMIADVVVSASTDPEAFGRVLPEAQAMGRIVVGTDHGGARETVKDGVTGFLVPPGDAKALADVLDKILDMPPDEKEKMKAASIESVKAEFSKAVMTKKTLDVYQELLDKGK